MISALRRFLDRNFSKQSRSNQTRGRSGRAPAGRRLNIESLEQRTLLTAVGLSAIDTVATETGYAVGNVQETPDYAEVQVTRSPSLFSATIGIKLEGAADAVSDYTLWRGSQVGQEMIYSPISVSSQIPDSGTGSYYRTASFPMGMDEAFVILQLRPVNDAVREIAEQATITLSYCQVSGYDMEPLSGSCSVTINDNDDWTVGVSSSDSSAAEAPAGSEDYATVRVTRSGETDVSNQLSIAFETYGDAGTGDYQLYAADGNGGYSSNSLTFSSYTDETTQQLRTRWNVTIPAGSTYLDVQLRPANDRLRELDEDVTFVVLPSVFEYESGSYLASSGTVTVTIDDNDDWTVGVSSSDSSAAEAPAGSEDYATVRFTRSGETDFTYSLDVAFDTYGDAATNDYYLWVESGPNEYVCLSEYYSYTDETTQEQRIRRNITIPAGSAYVDVQLRPVNDSRRELDEDVTFIVIPSNPAYGYGAYAASSGTATVTIDDNDDWIVSIAATDSEAAEAPSDALNPGVFTISRTNETDYTYPLEVRFKLTGSADYPYAEDYALTGPANSNLSLTGAIDAVTGEQYYIGTLTIPAGYASVDLYVRPRNDQKREETETAIATLQISLYVDPETNLPPYTLGTTQATVTIADNDQWMVAINATTATAAEEDALGVHYGYYSITRSGETDLTYPLRVYLRTSGTANSADYSVYLVNGAAGEAISLTPKVDPNTGEHYYSWSVQIPAGATSVSVEVRPVDDRDAERDETIVTSIQSNEQYLIDSGYGSSTITIEEDTTVTLTVVDSVALEPCVWITAQERRAQYRLEVSTTETNWNNVNVQLSVSGTATAGNNGSTGAYHLTLNPSGGVSSDVVQVVNGVATVVVPGGQTSLNFYLMPNGDYDFEQDEDVLLAIAQAFSRSTSNQVDCDSDDDVVSILQAPEFVSGNDPNPPLAVNADSYSRYINPSLDNNSLFGGQETKAVAPGNRSVRYSFYDETLGNSLNSFESDPLLTIDATTGEITKLRPMTEAEAASTLTFTIKARDSQYCQLYDLATLTLNAVEFSMVPYTPQTTYIDPMAIPDGLWKVNNVGIRRNTDYDNGGEVNDSLVSGVCVSENDLIQVKLDFDSSVPGVTYSILRDSSDLKFWKGATKAGGEYAFTNNECVLDSSCYVWAEYASSGNATHTLTLVARDSTTGETLYTEEMVFRPFESVTCAFVGEFETAGNVNASPGINGWVVSQLLNGYDVHVWDDGYDFLYDEYGNIIGGNMNNDCSIFGEGRAFDEVVNAINNRGVTKVAIVGYSHGGGSVYHLAWRMYWDGLDPGFGYTPRPDSITKAYSLVFTSYIDAVPNNYTAQGMLGLSLHSRPLGSAFHTNQFQTNNTPNGCSIPESDDNLDRTNLGLTHSNENLALSIDTNEVVVNFLTDRFHQKVSR